MSISLGLEGKISDLHLIRAESTYILAWGAFLFLLNTDFKKTKISFKKFGGLKHGVSIVETQCFNKRNTVFQAEK